MQESGRPQARARAHSARLRAPERSAPGTLLLSGFPALHPSLPSLAWVVLKAQM